MRIVLKGGIWKNVEDEILKAAIMKYGKNNWGRVASLLPRKSAKQCKARWYEWLDPSIKKTEWTREEEQRLLHLAKLLPNQWRTIAPLVGRTAGQCLEHYERLLDAAQADEGIKLDAKEDPRRLRPGERDPAPETRPARPDPVDMDEDEKEMLMEVRARLANTKGKKAKRKVREKQLERSRRIADIQKRRELKAAGIDLPRRRKRAREDGFDYANEIPLEKRAPAGFYSTQEEDTRARDKAADNVDFEAQMLHEAEERRRDAQERSARKLDSRQRKRLAGHDLPEALAKESRLADPPNARKRRRLDLPKPQVSEQELQEVVKLGHSGAEAAALAQSGSHIKATRGLLGDYQASSSSLPEPGRTVRTPASQNVVMEEAKNLLSMRNAQTPLLGGETPSLRGGTGYEGAQPASLRQPTPNAMVQRGGAASTGVAGDDRMQTPMSVSAASAAPSSASSHSRIGGGGRTPLRDALQINPQEGMGAVVGDAGARPGSLMSVSSFRGAGSDTPGGASVASSGAASSVFGGRRALAEQLAQLPEPKYSYEIVAPEMEDDDDDEAQTAGRNEMPIDAEELERQRATAAKEAAEKALRRRSSVFQVSPVLPRPRRLHPDAITRDWGDVAAGAEGGQEDAQALQEAVRQIQEECVLLQQQDGVEFPVDGSGTVPRNVPPREFIPDESIEAARSLLQAETRRLRDERGGPSEADEAKWWAEWEALRRSMVFDPSTGQFVPSDQLSEEALKQALESEHGRMRNAFAKEQKRLSKKAQKVRILLAGLQQRAKETWTQFEEHRDGANRLRLQEVAYAALEALEREALPHRRELSERELSWQETRERALQRRYQELQDQIRDMRRVLESQ